MSQQSRPAWARLPFMARASQNPSPAAPTAPPTAPPPTQPPQPQGPFRQLGRTPSVLSQPQEPTPPSPPAATPTPPPSPPLAPARSLPRSPVKRPVPAPSTPRKSPISAPPTVAPSPKPSPPLPPRETINSSTSKSPVINTLSNSPVPKEPLTTTANVRVPSSPIRDSPKTKSQAPSFSMAASSPVPKPVATAARESSPKTVKPLEKTPVQYPKPKPVARPPSPSPFALPPSQLKSDSEREAKIPTKVDQKDVLVQETIEKFPKLMPSNSHNGSIASNGEQEFPKEKVQISDSEKLGMSVITLAGENKGAVMDLSPSRNKIHSITNPHTLHNNGNHAKPWSDGEKSSSSEEGKSNKEKKNKKAMAMQSPPTTAYVNSNVQGVNNSILFNGSSTHNNPGVHLSFSRKPNGGHGIHFEDHNAK